GNINLDKLSKFADLKHLIITNSMHQVLYSTTSYNNQINVSNLKNGIYILRTINKKGISHKLGYFEKRTKNTN
ncbi:MAG: T9SS type A sorting domain-containing protein, partial [Prevotella sp.]|nr:T9SS type A sorting domain-containing protein [Prevotella sp.]